LLNKWRYEVDNTVDESIAGKVEAFLEDNLSVSDAVEKYLEIRAELDIKRKIYNAFESDSKEAMQHISRWLIRIADDMGTDSFACRGVGTAFRTKKTRYSICDFDALVEYVKETDNFQIFEKRAAKLATKEIHDSEGLPPGIDYYEEEEFQIRKPTN
jgi:hypothetical protein